MMDTPPRDGLKLKPSASITGAACCPNCGGLLSSPSATTCPHCHSMQSAATPVRRSRPRGPGARSALAIWLGGLFRFFLFLVLVALLAVGGTLAYQRWWPGAKQAEATPAPITSPCPDCQGTGSIRCSVCGGAGRLDGVTVHTPCEQCGGTGLYQHKMMKSAVRCPFCRGTGTKGSQQAHVVCATCGGEGFVPCPACGGSGRKKAGPVASP